MDNISRKERNDGCDPLFGSSIGVVMLIIFIAIWSKLAPYILGGIAIIICIISLFTRNDQP